MSRLLAENAEAAAWIDHVIAGLSQQGIFGKLTGGVIWSDVTGADGNPLVSVDPADLVADINAKSYPLLKGHDPGFPLGKVLAAEAFAGKDGTRFITAVIGYYHGTRLSFRDLGLDSIPAILAPTRLPTLPDDCWISLASDPKEIDPEWVEDVIRVAPIRVEPTELSHNAADSIHELIRVGVLFMVLVWNPLVTAIATEAGKDAYASMRRWLRHLVEKIAELREPILEIQSHHNECYVSFILRGKDASCHYAAIHALSSAAAQAQYLITNLKHRGLTPKLIVYEFQLQDEIWFPSYAELSDGRLVTDNKQLIAIEQLPSGLSLGLGRGRKSRIPNVKSTKPN